MPDDLADLRVRITADTRRFRQDMDRTRRNFDRASDSIERRAAETRRRLGDVNRAGGLSRQGNASLANVGQQIQDIAVQAESGTGALRIFAQQGPQILGAFGPVGAMLGAVAAVGGAVAAAYFATADRSKTLAEATDSLSKALRGIQDAQAIASMSMNELQQKFGENIVSALDWQRTINEISISQARREIEELDVSLGDLSNSFASASPFDLGLAAGTGGFRAAQESFQATIQQLQQAFGATEEQAIRLNQLLLEAANTEGYEAQARVVERMRDLLRETEGGLSNIPPKAQEILAAFGRMTQALYELEKTTGDAEAAQERLNIAVESGVTLMDAFANEASRAKTELDEAARAANRAFNNASTMFSIRFKDEEKLMGLSVESTVPPRRPVRTARRSGGARSAPRRDAFPAAAKEAQERIDKLNEETALIGMKGDELSRARAAMEANRLEQKLLAKAQEDGTKVTEAERAAIKGLKQDLLSANEAQIMATERARQFEEGIAAAIRAGEEARAANQQAFDAISNSISSAITQADSFSDALRRVGLAIANIGLNALFGQGPAGGFFNRLIGSTGNGVLGLLGLGGGGGGGLFSAPALGSSLSTAVPVTFSALGNAFAGGRVIPFARGGVISTPTAFPMQGGIGLMAEAGAEAIMPLARGRGGRLGVVASGASGGDTFVIQVDARGAQKGVAEQLRAAAPDMMARIRTDQRMRGRKK